MTAVYRPGGPEILRDFTLGIRPGEVVGIVGRSGSGKSTLTKLLQRLYLPERGRVFVDGIDIALLDPAWLRRGNGGQYRRHKRTQILHAIEYRDLSCTP